MAHDNGKIGRMGWTIAGYVLQLAGLGITGWGLVKTWLDNHTEGEHFLTLLPWLDRPWQWSRRVVLRRPAPVQSMEVELGVPVDLQVSDYAPTVKTDPGAPLAERFDKLELSHRSLVNHVNTLLANYHRTSRDAEKQEEVVERQLEAVQRSAEEHTRRTAVSGLGVAVVGLFVNFVGVALSWLGS